MVRRGASANTSIATRIILSKRIDLAGIYDKLYEFYGPQSWWPARTRFEVIVGAILTQNTSWENVKKALANLKKAKALSPGRIKKINERHLASLIRPSGYYNLKAKRLKNFTTFLDSKYDLSLNRAASCKTARLRQELLGVSGIGPETADSILLYAFNRPVFVIDAYTKRIFSRHKVLDKNADYEEMQDFFMANLPKNVKLYNEYHALIVRLCKELCKARPQCRLCPLEKHKITCK